MFDFGFETRIRSKTISPLLTGLINEALQNMAPFDRSYTTWSAIVSIALSCTIFELLDVKCSTVDSMPKWPLWATLTSKSQGRSIQHEITCKLGRDLPLVKISCTSCIIFCVRLYTDRQNDRLTDEPTWLHNLRLGGANNPPQRSCSVNEDCTTLNFT